MNNITRANAEKLVMRLGISPTLRGYYELIECVYMSASDRAAGMCELYRRIAEKENISPKSVMRNISYAVNHAYDTGSCLSELVGMPVNMSVIHNGLIIAYLSKLLASPDMFKETK